MMMFCNAYPFPAMLPVPIPRHIMLPPRVTLPGVEATLQNDDLWKQFHQIGTEMIITKSGRRMFPSMRLSLSGLEDDVNYCVLLEMVPIGDCRYKFSGSQWVPAGGAEPQSPQRMYLHPDSPAQGSHWQAQPILFNKVKLTNNTLDNNGHVVLTSMHKYQPRIHIIRTSDPTQIPWAPQQAFFFPETEFVAVTAYQNDRITKLKIDNNPFAKGFRETGQSRCKRKITSSSSDQQQTSSLSGSPIKVAAMSNTSSSSSASSSLTSSGSTTEKLRSPDDLGPGYEIDNPSNIKRMRSNSSACSVSSLDDSGLSISGSSSGASSPANPVLDDIRHPPYHHPPGLRIRGDMFFQHIHQNMQGFINPSLVDLACSYFGRSPYPGHFYPPAATTHGPIAPPCGLSPPLRHIPGEFLSPQMCDMKSFTGSPAPADVAPAIERSPSLNFKSGEDRKVSRKTSFTISAILGDDH